MRDIKFRAWDKINKFMFYPEYIGTNDKNCFPDTGREASEFELMQFTGLKDKNGKEIYEGDLIKLGSPYDNKLFVTREVQYKSEGITGYHLYGNEHNEPILFPMDSIDIEYYEIIGNIYE